MLTWLPVTAAAISRGTEDDEESGVVRYNQGGLK